MKEQLQKFGTVSQYEEIEGKFHIRIEEFENTMHKTWQLMSLLLKEHPDFTKVHKYTVDKGIFHLILKK